MNRHARALLESLERPDGVPADPWTRLRGMLERYADTAFGRHFGFDRIRGPVDFSEAMPSMGYEEMRPWIERAAAGEASVLACGELLGFERTSGTSSRAKWIPMTDGLRGEFARAMAAWFGGWRHRCPEVFAGRAYWTVSPPGMPAESTAGGLPVGMPGDTAYFPEEIGSRLAEWLVVPRLSGDPSAVFEETALALLEEEELSLVSVWSPTFLLGIDAALRREIGEFSWKMRWPKLALVSCWCDASSAAWIGRLRERLDGIAIEGKGLLATEGVTSLPDGIDGSPRLAAECHWHEFLDDGGRACTASDLKPGAVYEVLLTTSGGLYRYRTGDQVWVTGFGTDGLPRMRFVGRTGVTSDFVGEKLSERQAVDALAGDGFLLANRGGPGYQLWIGRSVDAALVERRLRNNPYLDQALAIRQLAPFDVRRLPDEWELKLALGIAERNGCRVGDVKIPALITSMDPEEVALWLD